jgi:mono/diheme cytochrome c family protein
MGTFRWAVVVSFLTAPSVIMAEDAPIEAGRIAYLRECAGCHGESARGNGPDAAFLASKPTDLRGSRVLDVYREADLQARIREGTILALELRPEDLAEHAQDTAALYDFLVRLPRTDWEKVAAGEELYFSRCLSCHDRYGHPAALPLTGVRKVPRDLADPTFQRAVSDEELHLLARHGKAAMPVRPVL